MATIHNSGTVISTESSHYGVYLGGGGLLVNGSATVIGGADARVGPVVPISSTIRSVHCAMGSSS